MSEKQLLSKEINELVLTINQKIESAKNLGLEVDIDTFGKMSLSDKSLRVVIFEKVTY
jgi:nucleoid DNA-binding protein